MQENRPSKVCHYGENCYRKNPNHFKEFSHPHLDDIFSMGKESSTKDYKIPDSLFLSRDVIKVQLDILEKLFSEPRANDITENNNECKKEQGYTKDLKNTSCLDKDTNVIYISDDDILQQTNINEEYSVERKNPEPSTSAADGSTLPKKPKIDKNISDYIKVVVPRGGMAKKLEKAAPYNFFLTAITDSKATHNEPLSITFQEILDDSLGQIESSVQINFMIDIGWLLGHYYFAGCLENPLLVLYGQETPELQIITQHKPQVTAIKVQMSSPFATHHTKMMLLGYKDGSMRVVISTANLYEDDWHNRTQGLWMSPKLNPVPEDADTIFGESPTEFRYDLLRYLAEYKISKLQPWIGRIRKTDFRSVKVVFVASVPGGFRETSHGFLWGHARLGSILAKYSAKIDESCPVIAQSSSIGSLGPNSQSWLISDFCNSARRDSAPLGLRRIPAVKMIYPSFNNVKNSHDDLLGGGCLPYGKKTNDKQLWLKEHLCQWKSNSRYRTKAMPHIKTYCRYSDSGIYWFVLTSANLSKSAWGAFNKNKKIEPVLRISNYEVGVVFLPKLLINKGTFPMTKAENNHPPFPMPFDVPLTPYAPDDKPFVMDYLMSIME